MAFSGIERFFAWWLGELQSVLPQYLRKRISDSSDQLRLLLCDTGARFRSGSGTESRNLGSIEFDTDSPQLQRDRVQNLLKPVIGKAREVTILLDDGKVLRPEVELPQAAEENLIEVLAFEMDRNTPFLADEVYFDHRVRAVDKELKRITVDLGVAPRGEVHEALRVARAWGLQPSCIAIPDEAGEPAFDLMPSGERKPRGRLLQRSLGALAIVACILVGAMLYLPLKQKEDQLASIQARLEQVRLKASATSKLQERVDAMIQRAPFAAERKHESLAVTVLLHEVTRLLPDDSWLIHFGWRQGNLRLAGYSARPTALIRLLEQSDHLSEVSFASPVTFDPRLGAERFNIAARVTASGGMGTQ